MSVCHCIECLIGRGGEPKDEESRNKTGAACLYPSDDDLNGWHQDFHEELTASGARSYSSTQYQRYLVRRACDWQREQDALICEIEEEFLKSDQDGGSGACRICADNIRNPVAPPQPGAAQ